MKKKIDASLFSAILYILLGVLLVTFRSEMLGIAMTIAGVIFVISGVLEVLKRNFIGGAVSLIIGIAILVLGWTATKIVLLVLGILIAIKGLFAVIDVLRAKRKSIFKLIFPILTIAVGILLAFGNGLDILIVIGGVLLIIDGVIGLIAAIKR